MISANDVICDRAILSRMLLVNRFTSAPQAQVPLCELFLQIFMGSQPDIF